MFAQKFKVLLESELEKAEIVLAVKAITDELQSMAEKISKMQVEDISAITERIKAESGTESGTEFQTSVNNILQQALSSLQDAKSSVDNEALFLSGDAQKNEMIPQETNDINDDETLDGEDIFGAHEAGESPAEEPVGRVKKESIQSSSKVISEDFEIDDFDTSNLEPAKLPGETAMNASLRHIDDAFSPEMKDRSSKVYDIAREAELVAVGRLKKSIEEQKDLRDELSDEIENIVKSLAQLHPTDYGKIVALSGLAKVLVRAKRKLDDLINSQVREHTMIKMESMVKELKARGLTESETFKKSVAILEKWKEDAKINPKKKGMFDGWTVADLKKERTRLKKKEERTAAESTKLKEVNYAIRAKTGWGKVDESVITEAATRKDFRQVAELLKNVENKDKRKELAKHHAEIFKKQNPRFSTEKFYAAADVVDESTCVKKK
jgi:hypothetical protein